LRYLLVALIVFGTSFSVACFPRFGRVAWAAPLALPICIVALTKSANSLGDAASRREQLGTAVLVATIIGVLSLLGVCAGRLVVMLRARKEPR